MTRWLFILGLNLVATCASVVYATTWDEPWAKDVIKEAEFFVFGEIIESSENAIVIKINKQLGGEKIKDSVITIDNFYLLAITSLSGNHGPEFRFAKGMKCYFFLRQNTTKNYSIATPTTGFDVLHKSKVTANFRHSYHQCSIEQELYETAMAAVFNHYHKLDYELAPIKKHLDLYLRQRPAGFEKHEIEIFFNQHVALELIYHLSISTPIELLLPFFNDTENFHNRISAARAFSANRDEASKQILFNKIANNEDDDFVALMCVWSLEKMDASSMKQELAGILEKSSKTYLSFGGNLMDPRVGTSLPSVYKALSELLSKI